MKHSNFETLTMNTAIKVSHYIAKFWKSRKVRKERTEEDVKKLNELQGLTWALHNAISALNDLSSMDCSEELVSDTRHLAVSLCEKIKEIVE